MVSLKKSLHASHRFFRHGQLPLVLDSYRRQNRNHHQGKKRQKRNHDKGFHVIISGTEKRKNNETERLGKRYCDDPKCEINRRGIRHSHGEGMRLELTPQEKAEVKSMEKKVGKPCKCGHYKKEYFEKSDEFDRSVWDQYESGMVIRPSCRKCECDYYVSTGRFFRNSRYVGFWKTCELVWKFDRSKFVKKNKIQIKSFNVYQINLCIYT